jgi:hypothetical protein
LFPFRAKSETKFGEALVLSGGNPRQSSAPSSRIEYLGRTSLSVGVDRRPTLVLWVYRWCQKMRAHGTLECTGRENAMSQERQTSATVLSELLEPVGQLMPVEFARELAALRATPNMQAKIDDLADKANEGQLTNEERAQYLAYVDAIDVISVLQATARSVIDRQPNA